MGTHTAQDWSGWYSLSETMDDDSLITPILSLIGFFRILLSKVETLF